MLTKRFIAGAICPSCQKVDKVCWEKSSTSQKIECVNCGFTETKANDLAQEENPNF